MRTYVNIALYPLALTLVLSSCNNDNAPGLAPEDLFDNDELKVISSVINEKKGTISIIYGNDLAFQSAKDESKQHYEGELYKMVTWKQKPMPHWYGTDMNGAIVSVETVEVSKKADGELSFNYHVEPGPNKEAIPKDHDKERRSAFIVNQRAAVFP
ncbi:hypothetical protein [Desertivirga brevis]|uniref:hypothetical protein n=1 Tax=Desertivirga brevis TaxID=2810310 RepID=UPI001A971AF4|nr:hypothetical protein [Pedobacter sp. SYSU D00873]